jgi:hypothetical protein
MIPSPKSVNQFLLIPRKLVLCARLDRHMAVTVDVLIDECVLGTNESIEMRTRALIGLFASLVEKKASDQEGRTKKITDEMSTPLLNEPDRYEARKLFTDIILGSKAKLHKLVNDLLALYQRLTAAKASGATEEYERLERQKHAYLAVLAKELHFESDATVEDISATLHAIIFESKDKNIHKYLRALANPLTEYQQIRLAQSALTACVKSMTAQANKGNKKVSMHSTPHRHASHVPVPSLTDVVCSADLIVCSVSVCESGCVGDALGYDDVDGDPAIGECRDDLS